MSAPLPYFHVQPAGLVVQFINRSIGEVDSFSWEFGDGQTSSDENPIHTYSKAGNYTVKLTVTNVDGSNEVSLTNYYSTGELNLRPILYIVKDRLPADTTFSEQEIYESIKYWQDFLYSSLPSDVSEENRFDETKYSLLENTFISRLVLIDAIREGANQYLQTLSAGAASGAQGDIKKITTGPAEAEWFSASSSWYNIMRPGGLYGQIQNEICYMGNILKLRAPGCEGRKTVIPFQSKYPILKGVSPDNQFTINLPFGNDSTVSLG